MNQDKCIAHRNIKGYDVYFFPSAMKNKKYRAFVKSPWGPSGKSYNFGDTRYQHYFDQLGLYSHLNHNDKTRRESYRKRHANTATKFPSPSYFAYNFLW